MRVCPFEHDHPESDWSYEDCMNAYRDMQARQGTRSRNHKCAWCGSRVGAVIRFPSGTYAHWNCALTSQKWGRPVVTVEEMQS
jgi:hypothetical protein